MTRGSNISSKNSLQIKKTADPANLTSDFEHLLPLMSARGLAPDSESSPKSAALISEVASSKSL